MKDAGFQSIIIKKMLNSNLIYGTGISGRSRIKMKIKNKNILVTGAAGFIGFHLSKRLLDDGNNVVGIDNINDYYDVNLKLARLAILQKYSNFTFYKKDIADLHDMEILFSNQRKTAFDVVINLAAQAGVRYSLKNPHSYISSNIVGFTNILECCRHNKIKHLVFASSSSIYGMNDKDSVLGKR